MVVDTDKRMLAFFYHLETRGNLWKRAETKHQHSSSIVNKIKQSQTESNETEWD
jgi:hypothetical protein